MTAITPERRAELRHYWTNVFDANGLLNKSMRLEMLALLDAADDADRLRALLLEVRDGWPMLPRRLTRKVDAAIAGEGRP